MLVRLVFVDFVDLGRSLLDWRGDWVVDGAALKVRDPDDVVCILLDAVGVSWETYHY